jgi:Transposase DDE domain group 1
MARLGLEGLINQTVRLAGRVGGSRPGRKVLTLVATILAGGSHIDHADVLRAGATRAVLPFRVMAPSTLGTFLRAFTFGHVRQLDAVIAEALRRAWRLGAGPSDETMTIDLDSTICEVHGHQKQGAAYGYTRKLGYHPLLATWRRPARCSTPGCARVPASGAPNVSSKNSSPASAGPAHPKPSACVPMRGSGRMA